MGGLPPKQTEGLNALAAARAPISERPFILKHEFRFAIRRSPAKRDGDEARPGAEIRGERKKEVMRMLDAVEHGTHRAQPTTRGRRSEVRL